MEGCLPTRGQGGSGKQVTRATVAHTGQGRLVQIMTIGPVSGRGISNLGDDPPSREIPRAGQRLLRGSPPRPQKGGLRLVEMAAVD